MGKWLIWKNSKKVYSKSSSRNGCSRLSWWMGSLKTSATAKHWPKRSCFSNWCWETKPALLSKPRSNLLYPGLWDTFYWIFLELSNCCWWFLKISLGFQTVDRKHWWSKKTWIRRNQYFHFLNRCWCCHWLIVLNLTSKSERRNGIPLPYGHH